MESVTTSLADVLQKDFLTCGICTDFYKTPKLLPCLHSYCEECLSLLVKKQTLQCPECRLRVEIKESVSALKTNFFINNLLKLFQSRNMKDLEDANCSSCHKALPPTSHCLDCSNFLCLTCTKSPLCSCLLLGHKIVDLKPFLTGQHDAEARLRQEMFCQDHKQEPLMFFCDSCSIAICKECHVLGHIQHQVVPMAEAVLKKKPEVKELVESLELNVRSISEQEEELKGELEMLGTVAVGINQSIHSYVSEVTAHLLRQKEATLEELDQFLRQRLEQYLCVKWELQSQKERLLGAKEFTQKVIDVGKDCDFMSMEGVIRDRIHELKLFKPQWVDQQIPQLVVGWDQNELSELQHFSLLFTREQSEEDLESNPELPLVDSLPPREVLPTRGGVPLEHSLPTGGNIPAMDVRPRGHSLPSRFAFFFKDICSNDESYGWSEEYSSSDEGDSTDEGATSDGDDWFLSRTVPPKNPRPICVCTFEINQYTDCAISKITGVTVLSSSGDILMCDKVNDAIKWFSADGVAGKRTLHPEPECSLPLCGITVCGNTIVCSAGCYLLFLTLQEKLLLKIKLRGPHPPYAIASYKSSYVAVSEGTLCSVSLYNTSGQYLDRVHPKGCEGGKFLFIAVNSKEVFIVSDFFQKRIILFQRSGEIVGILDTSTPLLREPFSVCVDGHDHVFVVDQERVLELTPGGEFGRVILSAENGVEEPRVIAVDNRRRLILVQKKNHGKIFQLC